MMKISLPPTSKRATALRPGLKPPSTAKQICARCARVPAAPRPRPPASGPECAHSCARPHVLLGNGPSCGVGLPCPLARARGCEPIPDGWAACPCSCQPLLAFSAGPRSGCLANAAGDRSPDSRVSRAARGVLVLLVWLISTCLVWLISTL